MWNRLGHLAQPLLFLVSRHLRLGQTTPRNQEDVFYSKSLEHEGLSDCFKSCLCLLLTVWPWASYFTFLSLGFFLCKMKIIFISWYHRIRWKRSNRMNYLAYNQCSITDPRLMLKWSKLLPGSDAVCLDDGWLGSVSASLLLLNIPGIKPKLNS